MPQYGWLLDPKRCIECRACEAACKQWNKVPFGVRLRQVRIYESAAGRVSALAGACNHCENAWCIKVCPVKAIWRNESGAISIDENSCLGCRQCYAFCPYQAPQWNKERKVMQKCDQCPDRVEAGQLPACAALCPTGALSFAKWEDIKNTGVARIENVSDPTGTRPRIRFVNAGFPGQ